MAPSYGAWQPISNIHKKACHSVPPTDRRIDRFPIMNLDPGSAADQNLKILNRWQLQNTGASLVRVKSLSRAFLMKVSCALLQKTHSCSECLV